MGFSKSVGRKFGEHPNPTTEMGLKMGGELTYQPKWDPIGVDPQSCESLSKPGTKMVNPEPCKELERRPQPNRF